MAKLIDGADEINIALYEKVNDVYNNGAFNDLAPPHHVSIYLKKSRTLFLCDAELCDEDIINMSHFLGENIALNHIEHIEVSRTSASQVKYRRIVNRREKSASSLNYNNSKLFKDVVQFIKTARSLRTISFQDVDIGVDVISLLSAALVGSEAPIQWLNFVRCNFGSDNGLRLLTPSIGRMHSLSVLSLEQCGLTDTSIPYVASIIKAHASQLDSLFWNSQLRLNDVDVSAPDQTERANAVLGKGLVAISLFGNYIEGKNISYLTKVLKGNYWLLAFNIADNKLGQASIAVMMNDLLTKENKMRALLLRGNPGLQPYTARSLLSFMENTAVAASQLSQLKSNSAAAGNESFASVDGQKRFQLLAEAEAQLVRHWMHLQQLEASATEDEVVAVESTPIARPSVRRYSSPSLKRYNRGKGDNTKDSTTANDSSFLDSKYRTGDFAHQLREQQWRDIMERAQHRKESATKSRELIRKKSPSSTSAPSSKRLSASPPLFRSREEREGGEQRRPWKGAGAVTRSSSPFAGKFTFSRSMGGIDAVDLLNMGLPSSSERGAGRSERGRSRKEEPSSTRRKLSRYAEATELSSARRPTEALRSGNRVGEGHRHRSPVPNKAKSTRRTQSPPVRRYRSPSSAGYPSGHDAAQIHRENSSGLRYYERVLLRRQEVENDFDKDDGNWEGARRPQTEPTVDTGGRRRRLSATSEDMQYSQEVREEKSVYNTAHSKASGKGGRGGRTRTDSEYTDATGTDRESRAGTDLVVERHAAYLEQCITSVLNASTHLEQVSVKLQGVVDTLSESMNISVSMQRQQQALASKDYSQDISGDQFAYLNISSHSTEVTNLRDRTSHLQSYAQPQYQSQGIRSASASNRQQASATQAQNEGSKGPNYSVPVSSINREEYESRGFQGDDGRHNSFAANAREGSSSGYVAATEVEGEHFSELIKERMRSKLRELLAPEFSSS